MTLDNLFILVIAFGFLTTINSVLVGILLSKRTDDLRLANRALEILLKNIKYEFEGENIDEK